MTPSLAWVYLVASGLIDVAWALSMKKAEGFANPLWSAISLLLLAMFVYLLTKSLQILPVGTAYAVWTGIGASSPGLFCSPSPRRPCACCASPSWWSASSA